MTQSIELYYWLTPNVWKIAIALEEMNQPFILKPVNVWAGEQFLLEYARVNPNNKVPAITDPAGPGGQPITVFESGAILQYLGRKTGLFYGRDEHQRTEIDSWLMWQMAGLGPMGGQYVHWKHYAPSLVERSEQLEYGYTRYRNEVDRLLGVLERRLKDRDFLAGPYSVADMACYPWIAGLMNFDIDISAFGQLNDWFNRLSSRAAVQRGMAVGQELGLTPPAPGTDAGNAACRILFGQTSRSTLTAESTQGCCS